MHCQTALLFPQERNLSKKCDKSLLAEKMPVDAVDARCRLQNTKQNICLYCKGTSTKSILFDITAYGNNLLASQIHGSSMLHHDSVICEQCHNTIFAGIPTDMHNLWTDSCKEVFGW